MNAGTVTLGTEAIIAIYNAFQAEQQRRALTAVETERLTVELRAASEARARSADAEFEAAVEAALNAQADDKAK